MLELHFTTHTFLVGERITLADLLLGSQISRGFQFVLDAPWRDAHPATTRWYETLTNQPIWKAVVEKPIMIEEAVKYTPPKKEKAPKAEAAPKAAAAKKPAKEEEDDDEPKPEAPKAKHPLEALPKPTLILDDWKRKYSNEETREVALPWFWEQYKPDEYSLWRVDYKYNDELTMTFMSNNLVGETSSPISSKSPPLTIHRWFLRPPRSLPQIPLWRSLRLRPDQRQHHPRRLHGARRRGTARFRRCT